MPIQNLNLACYNDEMILIDEVLTPDSSRFWSMKAYKPGFSQDSYDKQIVRDYLNTLDWDKTYPGPQLPEDVAQKARGTLYRDSHHPYR